MSDPNKSATPSPSPTDPKVQGEGDYEAARRYREEAQKFAASGQAESAAKRAAPKDAQERDDMVAAEQEGKRHSKASGK